MNLRSLMKLCGVLVTVNALAAPANGAIDPPFRFIPVVPILNVLPVPKKDAGHAKQLAGVRELLAKHEKDGQYSHLEAAWGPLSEVLSNSADSGQTTEALDLASALVPRLRLDFVKPWLVSYATTKPERALEVVEALGKPFGSLTKNPDRRAKLLKLQSSALNTYLEKAAEPLAEEPQKVLVKYATTWMEEAESARREAAQQPTIQPTRPGLPAQPVPVPTMRSSNTIPVYDLIDAAPGKRFITALKADFQSKLLESLVRTQLLEGDEPGAFSGIEQLAGAKHPTTPQLVVEFLQAWMRNHNPNPPPLPGAPTQPAQVIYGPNGQATVVRGGAVMPVTRTHQEENLDDLAKWVARIRKLPDAQPDESLLIQAFISCYTANAIYTRDSLQAVLGPPQELKAESLRRLTDQMRTNVNTLRQQLTQQRSTRKPEDLQADALAGYATARALLDDSVAKQPKDWRLALTRAVVTFDELDFQHDIQPKPDFATRRTQVMDEFARAAGLYASQLDDRIESSPNLTVYEQWFAAALGATDMQNLTEAKLPDLNQPKKIRAAMLALPGEAGERHVADFAASLYPRIMAVKPALKPRYLRMGAEVVDNHPRLGPAKKLLAYYKDLSKEMRLDVSLDGTPAVGSMEPFGVFVQLKHTKELEQGSGGFGRFLQNQVGNAMAYNYGRPAANYRDRFENAMNAALAEHFEVVSCTFETDKVVSRPTPEEGWRVTPYAYLLLKARGPQVDRLPPLQLDLDFMDTSGFVVLAVESTAVPINASRRDTRPAERITVTQTIDERKSSEGVLRLEVKASARGMVPDLTNLITPIPEGFETVKTDTHALSIVKFDPDAPKTAVMSERTWLLTLNIKPNQSHSHFRFPSATTPDIEVKYQRYRDADIVPAEQEIEVGAVGSPFMKYGWYLGVGIAGVVVLAATALAVSRLWFRGGAQEQPTVLSAPASVTPVTVVGYLRTVAKLGNLTDSQRSELQQTVHRLEEYYFSGQPGEGNPPELKSLVDRWAKVAIG